MRLDCVTLWIDDQIENIVSTQQNFKTRVSRLGFDVICYPCPNLDEVSQYLSDSIFQDSVDLIFVDYNLGGNTFGDTALKQIRRVLPYKDIIFYSANNVDILLQKIFNAGVNGIFCSSRDELSEIGYSVFKNLVSKVLDIDHTRGIIMGAISNFDVIIKECIIALHCKCNSTCKCFDIIRDKIIKEKQNLSNKTDKILKCSNFDDIIRGNNVRGSYLLTDLLIDILDKNIFSHERDLLIKYKNDILPIRNKLAHAKLRPNDGSVIFEDDTGTAINEDTMRELRCQLIEHRENIRQLAEKLGVQETQLFSLERGRSA